MQTQATFTDDDSEYDSLPSLMIRGSNVSSSSDDTVSVELPSTNWINNGPASVPEAIDVFQCDLALTHDEVSIPSTHLRTSEGVPLTASEGRRLAINRDAEEDLATHDVASYANLLLSIEQGIRPSCLNSQYSIMAIDFELNMRNATATDETERAKLEKSDWEQFGYDAALSRMKSSLREQIRAYRYYKSSTCRHVRHILPKTYDPENCLFLEQLEAEYEKVGHYKYSSEDDEESMDVGEPLDKSELSEHLRQTCDAKESEKTTQLNYLMKISTDDDEDAIAFTGAWKEEEPDNFFPESGAEENRTWNEWMRFANRAKQTWNMKELKSKISSRKTLLLYAKNCRISTHLKEKLDNEDVNEYGNEVYDIYKKEQDEIKEQTNGSKKRGATIENEGENDNKTKRQKSP